MILSIVNLKNYVKYRSILVALVNLFKWIGIKILIILILLSLVNSWSLSYLTSKIQILSLSICHIQLGFLYYEVLTQLPLYYKVRWTPTRRINSTSQEKLIINFDFWDRIRIPIFKCSNGNVALSTGHLAMINLLTNQQQLQWNRPGFWSYF